MFHVKLWLPIILGANIITASAFVMTIHEKSRTTKAVILGLRTENTTLKQLVASKDEQITALAALVREQDKYIATHLTHTTGRKK